MTDDRLRVTEEDATEWRRQAENAMDLCAGTPHQVSDLHIRVLNLLDDRDRLLAQLTERGAGY